MAESYSMVVVRYAQAPIYVLNPPGQPPMSLWFEKVMKTRTYVEDEIITYGGFIAVATHVLAVADNQSP